MPSLEAQLAIEEDLAEVQAIVADAGALLEQDENDELVYWLTMSPRDVPQERYVARLQWRSYPDEAPSIKFADSVGGRLDLTSAWPIIPGYRAGAFDICQPFTREAYDVHPEWRVGPTAWTGTGNPFAWVVELMLIDMTSRYQGRSA